VAGIAHWVNGYLGLRPESALDKRHSGLVAINEWVKDQYGAGRVTSISDEEMLMQAQMYLPEYFKSDFDKLREHALAISEKIVETLAADSWVRTMDPGKIEPALQEAVHKHQFIQFIYVTDLSGKKITANVTQPEYRDEFGSFGLHEDFSDRDWFSGAIDEGGVFITDFYKSRITGALCITVSAPVLDDNGKAVGVIGADLRFEELARMHKAML
jgi:sensor histidine kinase regulating citrate/malate metabolism